MNDRKKAVHVGTVVLETVKGHLWLSLTILAVVAGAVGAALVPPLVLGRIVDGLTAGERLTLRLPLWYLAFTALAGGLESARESALTVFGQKTTHALRSRLMEKEGRLSADELNRQEPGALVSRFVVLDMPVISEENLQKLLRRGFPGLSDKWIQQFSALFRDLRQKCDNGEISTKALDLRGLLSSLHLIEKGITSGEALRLGIINKAFDPFERQLVADAVWSRIPKDADRSKLFGN